MIVTSCLLPLLHISVGRPDSRNYLESRQNRGNSKCIFLSFPKSGLLFPPPEKRIFSADINKVDTFARPKTKFLMSFTIAVVDDEK